MLPILVVDDDPAMRYLIRLMIQKLGYHPIEASNGREGEALALREQPALLLLDVMMPVQDGYTTVRNLRSQGYTGPITMISAVPEAEGIQQAADCGARGYLAKPFNAERLKLYVDYARVYGSDPKHAPTLSHWLEQDRSL